MHGCWHAQARLETWAPACAAPTGQAQLLVTCRALPPCHSMVGGASQQHPTLNSQIHWSGRVRGFSHSCQCNNRLWPAGGQPQRQRLQQPGQALSGHSGLRVPQQLPVQPAHLPEQRNRRSGESWTLRPAHQNNTQAAWGMCPKARQLRHDWYSGEWLPLVLVATRQGFADCSGPLLALECCWLMLPAAHAAALGRMQAMPQAGRLRRGCYG